MYSNSPQAASAQTYDPECEQLLSYFDCLNWCFAFREMPPIFNKFRPPVIERHESRKTKHMEYGLKVSMMQNILLRRSRQYSLDLTFEHLKMSTSRSWHNLAPEEECCLHFPAFYNLSRPTQDLCGPGSRSKSLKLFLHSFPLFQCCFCSCVVFIRWT